ncbi:MAG: HIT domain-containing protein [Candidatus Tumulicola sp.]
MAPQRFEPECIFCRIAAGEVASAPVYRDARILAIADVNPQAPTHLLVLPLDHYRDLPDLVETGGAELTNALLTTAAKLGREHGGAGGFRIVANTGSDGGQTVGHLHLHVLAGRRMTWPPG